MNRVHRYGLPFVVAALAACGGDKSWECLLEPGAAPDFVHELGCVTDFEALASDPPTVSVPGASSTKTIVDRSDADTLYFQNSTRYAVHYDFASANLSGDGLPVVPPRSQFSQTEYYTADRRFVLGALTYYQGPAVWTYEISPYDNASAELIELAYDRIRAASFIGEDLYFHPTSGEIEARIPELPDDIKVITTDELYAGIDFQPLNLGVSMGRLIFRTADELEGTYLSFRDIVVLDAVPNDISVTAGIITETFQTPLSHINVLSQNRGTPNMGLRGAFNDDALRALEGAWVRLEVGALSYSIAEVTQVEADAWWDAHRPPPLGVPDVDLTVTDLRDAEDVLDLTGNTLGAALDLAIPAFGGKASHFGGLVHVGAAAPTPKAFMIPIYYYWQFMIEHGFDVQVAAMLADETFRGDPATRDAQLAALREAMMAAPLDPAFEQAVIAKLNAEYPGVRMRFRSSTNAEDLDGFTGAGLYTSKSGDPNDPLYPVADAIREVWSSVWYFRGYEEREYRGIDHTAVGMALLVHNSFPDEEVNGVALTANIFDRLCIEKGFYINVQAGEASVVQPDPGVTTDQFVYHFTYPGQPSVWLSHSNLTPEGQDVLTRAQTYALGTGLAAIHDYFGQVYGSNSCDEFFAMDVEFKLDGAPGEEPALIFKQARPHPGWGL
jgi:hypothetical protein